MATGSTFGNDPNAPNYGIGPRGLGTEPIGTYGATAATDEQTSMGTTNAPKEKYKPGAAPGGYGAGSIQGQQNLLATAAPTAQQDIQSLLQPYINNLMTLGPEYQQEMNFLAPYLSPEHQTFNQVVAGSVADESPTGSKAVNAADTGAENAILNQPAPGFGKEAKAAEQYAAALPYQAQLQAGLGYQKYLQTYGGQAPDTSNWSPEAASAYAAIIGSNSGAGSTLGNPANAALAGQIQSGATLTSPTTGPGAGNG